VYKRILIASDGSPGAAHALETALSLAKLHGAELHMITVEELPRFAASIDEVAEEKDEADLRLAPMIAAARSRAGEVGVKLETHVAAGHVAQAVVDFVRGHGIDLLVVGFMGHSQLYERIIGSTTDRLVRLAPCAVLVVK